MVIKNDAYDFHDFGDKPIVIVAGDRDTTTLAHRTSVCVICICVINAPIEIK